MLPGFDPFWLVIAGFGAGITGSVAGLASLISYPALLAVGLSPVSANVSNTVALVFNGVGSVLGSGPELRSDRAQARTLAPVAIGGGLIGAVLLLETPSSAFALIVPWLIGAASLAILVRQSPAGSRAERHRPTWALQAGVFLIAIYGGYFGAAAGVLLLSVLLITTVQSLARSNALKNLLLGSANAVAALVFIVAGPVHWDAAIPLAVGCLAGSRLGPVIVRRVPAGPLRLLIGCAGIGLAVHLGLDAYR